MAERGATRRRMLTSAVDLMGERGAAAVTVDAVLSRSHAPRGSVYHHFPGGRREIIADALTAAGDTIGSMIDDAAAVGGSTAALDRFAEFWSTRLRQSDYTAGCPIVSVTAGGSDDDRALRDEVAGIFTRWTAALSRALVDDGVPADRAHSLSTTTVAAVEGAIILCRARGDVGPLDDVTRELGVMLRTAGGR